MLFKQTQQAVQVLQAFAFFVVNVNDENTKPRFKRNSRIKFKEMANLSSSIRGILFRCDLFRKRMDQKNFLLQQQITELYQQFDGLYNIFLLRIPLYSGKVVEKKKMENTGKHNSINNEHSQKNLCRIFKFLQKNNGINFRKNFTKCSNTLQKFVGNLPMNCLSAFNHFLRLVPKGLNQKRSNTYGQSIKKRMVTQNILLKSKMHFYIMRNTLWQSDYELGF